MITIYLKALVQPNLLLNLHVDETVKDWNDYKQACTYKIH